MPKRILVVDDDAQVRLFVCRLLEDAGFAVTPAENGAIALERVAADRPDLVSLDIVMPGLDGWAVVDRLQAMPDPPPVLLLTGQGELDPGHRLPPLVTALVHKAEDPRLFVDACRRVLAGPARENADVPGAERRRARRRPLVIPVRVSTTRGMALAEGRLVRLSPIGADLEVELPLGTVDPVSLAMLLPPSEETVRVQGQLHPRGTVGGTHVYGVSFIAPDVAVQKLLTQLLAS
jgi:CheY-like chemotaxis protein